jgi:CRP-like cAMP-binding protein
VTRPASRGPGRRRPGAEFEEPPAGDIALLARVPYFAALDASELRWLASRCVARRFRERATLFEEGQPCDGLFIIAEGAVEIRQVSLRGREQVFHSEGPGATLGEGPLFDRGGYIASAVATTPTRALLLPRADVLDLCRRHPSVALAILETLARRLRRFAEMVSDLAFRPIPERLARYLDGRAGRQGAARTEVELGLTHAQLAARLGTVRELVARAFSQLEQGGVIVRKRGRVVIRDPCRLARLAQGEP